MSVHPPPTRWRTIGLVAAAVLFATTSIWFGAQADHLSHPVASGIYKGYLAASTTLIGGLWLARRPESRLGYWLIALGVSFWLLSLQAAEWPPLYAVGTFADAPGLILTFYVCLAFPSGRLETRVDRAIVGLSIVRLAVFYTPHLLFTPVAQGGGPLSQCAPSCPDNAWFITAKPGLVELVGDIRTYLGLALAAAVIVVFLSRMWAASEPRRRARAAIVVTSLLLLPTYIMFQSARAVFHVDPETLDDLGWTLVATRVIFPLGFLLALLQADVLAARARRRLLAGLAHVRGPDDWRIAIAEALDDRSVRIAYWEPATGGYVEPDGRRLVPNSDPDRAWLRVDRRDSPVAVISADAAIAEDPELARAAVDATLIAVERGDLDRRLQASIDAGEAERRRLQRDLHDSTQQRLTALRINLGAAEELAAHDPEMDVLMRRIAAQVDDAVTELRSVAQGLQPRTLEHEGVVPALHERLGTRGGDLVVVADGFGRHDPAVESAIFFSCLEAVQNALKHAGPGAAVIVRLDASDDSLRFEVADDGTGFDPSIATSGLGLINITARMAAVGGATSVNSAIGRGTQVRGVVPMGSRTPRLPDTSPTEPV